MSEEEKEFKKQCDETLYSIYSKINEEEKTFFSYVVNQFNRICERNNKATEYIEENKLNGNKISEMLCGSEIIKLLEILKGDKE